MITGREKTKQGKLARTESAWRAVPMRSHTDLWDTLGLKECEKLSAELVLRLMDWQLAQMRRMTHDQQDCKQMPGSGSESAELTVKFEVRKASRENSYKAFPPTNRNSSIKILRKAKCRTLVQAGNMMRDHSFHKEDISSLGMQECTGVVLPWLEIQHHWHKELTSFNHGTRMHWWCGAPSAAVLGCSTKTVSNLIKGHQWFTRAGQLNQVVGMKLLRGYHMSYWFLHKQR